MTKIAIVTANIGNFDNAKGVCKQSVEFDYHYYDENNLPFPLPNLNNRLKSKYLKLQTHRFLPGYEMYIWLDASIKVNGGNFAETFVDQIKDHDAALYGHVERNNVYEEIEYIDTEIRKGNPYLVTRYASQQLVKEALFYAKNKLPFDYPLYNCYTFARMNNEKTNKCFDEWWKRCIEFSNFDQAMFSYVAWEADLKINKIQYDELRTHKLFTREPHI